MKEAEAEFLVVVKSVRLPRWVPLLLQLGRHTWFDCRLGAEGWRRYEIPSPSSGIVDKPISEEEGLSLRRWDRPVELLARVPGREVAERLREVVADTAAPRLYLPWPGPNSNTFAARTIRETDGLSAALHPDAVGRHFSWLPRITKCTSGKGYSLLSPILGATVAVSEGLELSPLAFTFAFRANPLSVKLPFLPAIRFGRVKG